ncbi:glutathione S-transferase Mu 5-like [Scyliorhinus torazame]|uniref:glutathione S-transferase Mu 5-like n=1 Tax=Scyliorhinus torazame TaxID=75743 RepID=UPI003B5B4C96
MAMKLGYWDIRGLAQPIRLLLEYCGTEYEEQFYSCGEAPNYDKSCWFDVKPKLGLDFPNLPYLFDGDVKITQSNAIMRYIARKHKLVGETEDEKVRVDMLENQAMDFRMGIVRLAYNPDFVSFATGYAWSLNVPFAFLLGLHGGQEGWTVLSNAFVSNHAVLTKTLITEDLHSAQSAQVSLSALFFPRFSSKLTSLYCHK